MLPLEFSNWIILFSTFKDRVFCKHVFYEHLWLLIVTLTVIRWSSATYYAEGKNVLWWVYILRALIIYITSIWWPRSKIQKHSDYFPSNETTFLRNSKFWVDLEKVQIWKSVIFHFTLGTTVKMAFCFLVSYRNANFIKLETIVEKWCSWKVMVAVE